MSPFGGLYVKHELQHGITGSIAAFALRPRKSTENKFAEKLKREKKRKMKLGSSEKDQILEGKEHFSCV
jgi:hypothetical protein